MKLHDLESNGKLLDVSVPLHFDLSLFKQTDQIVNTFTDNYSPVIEIRRIDSLTIAITEDHQVFRFWESNTVH